MRMTHVFILVRCLHLRATSDWFRERVEKKKRRLKHHFSTRAVPPLFFFLPRNLRWRTPATRAHPLRPTPEIHSSVGSSLARPPMGGARSSVAAIASWSSKLCPLITMSPAPFHFSLVRKVGAEFIGTFMLVFASAAAAIIEHQSGGAVTLWGVAVSSGFAAMIVIFSIGHISGAHLNPFVTIAFAAFKHLSWGKVLVYNAAQFSASLCAAFALKAIFYPIMGQGVTVPSGSPSSAFVMEFIIGFNLMFVTTAVATDARAVGELAGIAVGATVTLNGVIAGFV